MKIIPKRCPTLQLTIEFSESVPTKAELWRLRVTTRTEKRCPHCKQVKPVTEFRKDTKRPDGRGGYCCACANMRNREAHSRNKTRTKARHLRALHGITRDDYLAMLNAQGGGCAICGKPQDENRWHPLDHDHKTGKVRGILCNQCNTALGGFRDNPQFMLAAIEYLRTRSGDSI
jgi:hypothetical protein